MSSQNVISFTSDISLESINHAIVMATYVLIAILGVGMSWLYAATYLVFRGTHVRDVRLGVKNNKNNMSLSVLAKVSVACPVNYTNYRHKLNSVTSILVQI